MSVAAALQGREERSALVQCSGNDIQMRAVMRNGTRKELSQSTIRVNISIQLDRVCDPLGKTQAELPRPEAPNIVSQAANSLQKEPKHRFGLMELAFNALATGARTARFLFSSSPKDVGADIVTKLIILARNHLLIKNAWKSLVGDPEAVPTQPDATLPFPQFVQRASLYMLHHQAEDFFQTGQIASSDFVRFFTNAGALTEDGKFFKERLMNTYISTTEAHRDLADSLERLNADIKAFFSSQSAAMTSIVANANGGSSAVAQGGSGQQISLASGQSSNLSNVAQSSSSSRQYD